MSVQKYPWSVALYKGEGRILINPMIRHIGNYAIGSSFYICIKDTENAEEIGNGVLSAIKNIKESPISTINAKEQNENAVWKKESKYKSWTSFWKNNYCADYLIYEDGKCILYVRERMKEHKGVYNGALVKSELTIMAAAEEIGRAVINAFSIAEEYYGEKSTNNDYLLKTIELSAGLQLSIKPPRDKHFQDDGDSSAAEIYQCYSYHSTEEAESSAEIFLGIAPELDCNLNTNNIRSSWEDIHGKADHFEVQEVNCGIFGLRAEMKNKEVHKISYFLQQEEDLLLECSMEVHNPNRRKKLDEKMMQMYEEFALGCKL